MTIAQLQAFLAAFSKGSFTAAAAELGLTQASVSELVSRLERDLGVSLFMRGGRRLVATAAAQALRPHAEQALSAVRSGHETVAALTSLEGGTCTFGVLRNAAYYSLADLAETFHHRYPSVQVRLLGVNSVAVAQSIQSGEIEAGIVVLPVAEAGLAIRPLFRDEVLYASAHTPSSCLSISMEHLAASKLVLYDAFSGWEDPTRRQLLERFRLSGHSPKVAMEVEHVETALSIVASGAASTIVSRTIAESAHFPAGVTATVFAEPMYDIIALVQRQGTLLSPATQRLADLAEQLLVESISEHEGRLGFD